MTGAHCYRAEAGRLVRVDCRTGVPVAGGDAPPRAAKPRLSIGHLAALNAAPP